MGKTLEKPYRLEAFFRHATLGFPIRWGFPKLFSHPLHQILLVKFRPSFFWVTGKKNARSVYGESCLLVGHLFEEKTHLQVDFFEGLMFFFLPKIGRIQFSCYGIILSRFCSLKNCAWFGLVGDTIYIYIHIMTRCWLHKDFWDRFFYL